LNIHISVVVAAWNFHRKERLACQPLCSHIGNQLGTCRLRLVEFLNLDFARLLADAPEAPVSSACAATCPPVLYLAFSSLSAISGALPLFLLKRSNSAWRVTPRFSRLP
jgi:hypothetical protein